MTDLEICKRIAEIEELLNTRVILGENEHLQVNVGDFDLPLWVTYNPLTDDALCFQLMVKHGVDFVNRKDYYEVMFIKLNDSPLENWDSIEDENPNKAICLAIIEANES